MTDTNTKVRSLILTALMVISVFGGSIAFAGSAAAVNQVNNGSSSYSATVSPGEQTTGDTISFTLTDVSSQDTTEVVVSPSDGTEFTALSQASLTDGSTGQSASVNNDGDITFSLTASNNNGNVDVTLQDVDTQFAEPSQSEDVDFEVTATDSSDGSSANAIVATTTIDAGTNPGGAETLEDGGTYFQGQRLSFTDTDVSDNEEVEIRFAETANDGSTVAGQLVRQTSADATGNVIINTGNLEPDEYVVQESDSNTLVREFEVVQQDLTVSADNGEVVNSGSTTETLTVETNRAGQTTYTISADGLSMEDIESIFGTDADTSTDGFQVDVAQDSDLSADFDGIETGEYTLNFEAVDTTASDSVSVTVSEPAEGTLTFENTVVSEERGDVAEITVNMENTDTANVTIGSDAVNYAATVELVDGANGDADGTVTLTLNTFLTTNGAAAFGVADSDDGFTVYQATQYDSGLSTNAPLATADYELVLQDGNDNDVGVGTFVVSDRSTDSMQLWTAADLPTDAGQEGVYDALEAGDITQDNTIAYEDEVVHQIEVSGIYGALVNNMSDSDVDAEQALLNLVDSGVLSLSATQAGDFPNADPLTVDFAQTNTNGGLNVVADSANNTVFVALDTSNVAFDRGSSSASPSLDSLYGQTFDVEFGVSSDTALVAGDEDEVVSASFTVEERVAELNGGDDITVEAASGQEITGTTNVAPGTEINIRARASGSNPFLKTANGITVGADGTFSGTFDFSDVSENTTFTVTASSTGASFADAPITIDGTVGGAAEATPTPTPTPEPATDTPTPEPATDTPTPEPATDTPTPEPATDTPTEGGATETETSGSQPGFGGAVAIVALAGAALIALRRNN